MATTALRAVQDLEPSVEEFRAAVVAGLASSPKTLPCKFFYDAEGSRLFDLICDLPEYYPTRTESRILRDRAADIARIAGRGASLVEFGSGAGVKIRLLLSALDRPSAYVPVDISLRHLQAAAAGLARDFPWLAIAPICADYTRAFELPSGLGESGSIVGFFPGSTIGNFRPDEAVAFLDGARRLLGAGSAMVVGVDLRKDARVLHDAYDDAAGVTAAFNLNLLRRIVRELGASIRIDQFGHEGRWNDALSRIEMHLVSLSDQVVSMGGHRFALRAGETIHTENSYKYTVDQFRGLARAAGYEPIEAWTDQNKLFSVHVLRASP